MLSVSPATFLLKSRNHMAVCVHRDVDDTMAKAFLDDFRMYDGLEEQGGMCVSEMRAKAPLAGYLWTSWGCRIADPFVGGDHLLPDGGHAAAQVDILPPKGENFPHRTVLAARQRDAGETEEF